MICNLRFWCLRSHPCRHVCWMNKINQFEQETRHECTVDLSTSYKETKQYINFSLFFSVRVKIDSYVLSYFAWYKEPLSQK